MLASKLINAFRTGKIPDIEGNPIDFHSGIEEPEAEMLTKVINCEKPVITLEIGLAMGASAICFANAASELDPHSLHYAIDPNQFTDYGGAGYRLIKDAGLEKNFKLIEGKTHEVFDYFLKNGVKLDMAFIDGWHTFDYTFIDFFFIDKILKDGGILAFHDMYGLSKQKVLRFIQTHRDYEILHEYRIQEKDWIKTMKFFLWRLLKSPALLFSAFHWQFQTQSPYGIIFLRKRSSFEPGFTYYKSF
jgi:predicted O-methyltransferase YrrM